jgi:hypothetical protein
MEKMMNEYNEIGHYAFRVKVSKPIDFKDVIRKLQSEGAEDRIKEIKDEIDAELLNLYAVMQSGDAQKVETIKKKLTKLQKETVSLEM